MKNLWMIGLLIIVVGSAANGLLVQNDVGGIIREMMRVIILLGTGLFFFGIIQKLKKSKK